MIYKHSLEKLGYNLQDFGNHWRTKAVYRNGSTETSLIIYKDSGVWMDYGMNSEPLPFEALVRKTLKTNDPNKIKEFVSGETTFVKTEKEEKIEMEKIYTESMLEKLLPIRKFYLKRNISEKTQELFKCGYSCSGKMYRRIVFPVYNSYNQIHGFSGRIVNDDNKAPKWKHIGRKSSWIFPHHISKDFIEEKKEVILVESIGDCLALYESGFKNVLVTFGLDISPTLLSYLNSFDLDRIIVSLNNDNGKEINSGALGSIKILSKLALVFDLDILEYNPPLKANDFGDMLLEGVSFDDWYSRTSKWNLGDVECQSRIINKIKSTDSLNRVSACQKLIKQL